MSERDWEPVDALLTLLCLSCAERELWVDHRIVGMTPTLLARREGVSPHAISCRLRRIQRKLDLNPSFRSAA